MLGQSNYHNIEMPCRVEKLSELHNEVESVLSTALSSQSLYKLVMATDELATNIATYSNASIITITININEHEVILEIKDNGIFFDPFSIAINPPTSGTIDDREVGGLGLYLVKAMIERFSYRRVSNNNITRLEMPR